MPWTRPMTLAAAAFVAVLVGGCSYHDHHDYDRHPRHAVLLDDCGPYGPPSRVVRHHYEGRHHHDHYHRGYDRPHRDYGYRR